MTNSVKIERRGVIELKLLSQRGNTITNTEGYILLPLLFSLYFGSNFPDG